MWNEKITGKQVLVYEDWFYRTIDNLKSKYGESVAYKELRLSGVNFLDKEFKTPQKGSKEDMELRQWCITQALKRLDVEDYLAESERIYEWITSGKS